MITCFVLYDDANRPQETFAGPFRLALRTALPAGWCIEEFQGSVSKGITTLESVREYAAQLRRWFAAEGQV